VAAISSLLEKLSRGLIESINRNRLIVLSLRFVAMHKEGSLVLLSIFLLMINSAGCKQSPLTQTEQTPASITISIPPSPQILSPSPSVNTAGLLEQAVNKANSAVNLSQSAQSKDDWMLISRRLQEAIALLQSIPPHTPQYPEAQNRIATYQNNLVTAQKQANQAIPNVVLTAPVSSPTPTSAPNSASTEAIALANHLQQSGAILYTSTASSCADCLRQKNLFGDEAFTHLQVVQCSSSEDNTQSDACRDAHVTTYPAWHINGQTYLGFQSLEKLAEVSNYQPNPNSTPSP